MILRKLFERKPEPSQVLYESIVAAARDPDFYGNLGVPDTLDGRFDMITVHMFLVLDRLRSETGEANRQTLVDTFFQDMDRSLREMGVGDLSVGKKVRKMAEVFYGRVDAYRRVIDLGEQALAEALGRNIYADGGAEHSPQLAAHVLSMRQHLAAKTVDEIWEGDAFSRKSIA
jgi:cytochrome b pre-mRNA-processing protein 3